MYLSPASLSCLAQDLSMLIPQPTIYLAHRLQQPLTIICDLLPLFIRTEIQLCYCHVHMSVFSVSSNKQILIITTISGILFLAPTRGWFSLKYLSYYGPPLASVALHSLFLYSDTPSPHPFSFQLAQASYEPNLYLYKYPRNLVLVILLVQTNCADGTDSVPKCQHIKFRHQEWPKRIQHAQHDERLKSKVLISFAVNLKVTTDHHTYTRVSICYYQYYQHGNNANP
jgi:hypothetical protein